MRRSPLREDKAQKPGPTHIELPEDVMAAELDAVNGGVIPLAVPIVIAAVGLLVGGFGLGVGVGSGAIGDMLK